MGLKNFNIIATAALMASFYACSSDVNGAHENEITSSSNAEPISSSETVSSSSANNASSNSESSSSSSEVPLDPNLLWADEFNGTTINTAHWSFEIGNSGWGNNEWEYYTDRAENAYIKDGILHIRAIKENFETASYPSARMITKGKFSFVYGTIEARIALPVGKGIWPAFWMLGDNIDEVSWPACGEIDIIEAINDESVVYGTHHWAHDGAHANYGNSTRDYYGTSYPMDISEFHTYKMTWDKNAIAMYVDDFKYQEIAIAEAGDMDTFHKKLGLMV
jgi:beta-glucanase (GH16 family)